MNFKRRTFHVIVSAILACSSLQVVARGVNTKGDVFRVVTDSALDDNLNSENASDPSCTLDGKLHPSGSYIRRRHPCHVCHCYRGRLECYWQNCPPPPEGCSEMNYDTTCNPSMYLCPIPKHSDDYDLAAANRTKEKESVLKRLREEADCSILGVPYKMGEIIGVASHICLECLCAKGNSMYCIPRCCFQPAAINEEAALRTHQIGSRRRSGWNPVEPHPLAHLWEEFEKRRNTKRR